MAGPLPATITRRRLEQLCTAYWFEQEPIAEAHLREFLSKSPAEFEQAAHRSHMIRNALAELRSPGSEARHG